MEGDLKSTFIQKALQQYMQDVITTIKAYMIRNKIGVTNQGIQSFAFQVLQQGSEGGFANLSFKEYLRMVDMGAGRGHPLGGLMGMTVELQSKKYKGIALVKDKIRKPKKLYSRIAYGKLTWLENQLLYGYTEETIAMLKNELENK